MIGDKRNPARMEIAACCDIGRDLLPGRVVAEILHLQPDRGARNIVERPNDRAPFGGIAQQLHGEGERVDQIQFRAAAGNLVRRAAHHGDIAAQPLVVSGCSKNASAREAG